MERWFVENMIRCSGLPFVADAACETLEDLRYHYLRDRNYSLSLREFKFHCEGESYERTIVNFIADILVGPVKFGYKEIAFYVYVCRTLGIPPIHVTYALQEHVCIERIGTAMLGRPNAYAINGVTYDLPVGQSAFEFAKRELVHRIPEETNVICEFNNETFRVYKSKTEDHHNVKAFVEWAGESTGHLLEKPRPEVERFNVLIEPYQSRYEAASVNGAVYDACARQNRAGKFRATTSIVYFDDFEVASEILNYVKKVGNYKVTIERESATIGYMHGVDAGNTMAAYNLFALEAGKPTIRFEYELTKERRVNTANPPINRFWDLNALVTRQKRKAHSGKPVPLFEGPSTSQDRYDELLRDKLGVKQRLEHEGEKVFAEYTGNVVHIKTLVTDSPCKYHIINKPLVNFISKHKRETSSYYTQILAPVKFVPKPIKINCNFQGGEFLIRSKLAGLRCRLGRVCASDASSNQEDDVKISNQCIVAPGLMSGVINSHSFRNRTYMKSSNALKIPSFPGVHLIGLPEKESGDKNNILHRETMLVRMNKAHDMRDNIEELNRVIEPHVERIAELHDLVYRIESKTRKTLQNYVLGVVKTMYFDNGDVDEITRLFVERVFLNDHVVAQNGIDSFGFMCHSLKDTSALKNTSIKTTNRTIGYPPPQVEYTDKLKLLNETFPDFALTSDAKPRLRKKRGNFSAVMELAQAPTRVVNGPVGTRFAESVRKKLVSLGGYDSFADSMTVIDTILGRTMSPL